MPPKRKRRGTEPGSFTDPLSNYDPPQYADELEQALAEDQVADMEIRPFVAIAPDTRVGDAVRMMAESTIYSMLIVEADRLIGIFTERDVLNKVVDQWDVVKDKPVSELMTPNPTAVHETDPPGVALNLMAAGGFRHIPVLDFDDKVVGIVGPQRTSSYLRDHTPKD